MAVLGDVEKRVWGLDGGWRSSLGATSGFEPSVLRGAPFISCGPSSRPELRERSEGVLERSSCIDISFLERADPGVPAFEDVSLVGESERARSVHPR